MRSLSMNYNRPTRNYQALGQPQQKGSSLTSKAAGFLDLVAGATLFAATHMESAEAAPDSAPQAAPAPQQRQAMRPQQAPRQRMWAGLATAPMPA